MRSISFNCFIVNVNRLFKFNFLLRFLRQFLRCFSLWPCATANFRKLQLTNAVQTPFRTIYIFFKINSLLLWLLFGSANGSIDIVVSVHFTWPPACHCKTFPPYCSANRSSLHSDRWQCRERLLRLMRTVVILCKRAAQKIWGAEKVAFDRDGAAK